MPTLPLPQVVAAPAHRVSGCPTMRAAGQQRASSLRAAAWMPRLCACWSLNNALHPWAGRCETCAPVAVPWTHSPRPPCALQGRCLADPVHLKLGQAAPLSQQLLLGAPRIHHITNACGSGVQVLRIQGRWSRLQSVLASIIPTCLGFPRGDTAGCLYHKLLRALNDTAAQALHSCIAEVQIALHCLRGGAGLTAASKSASSSQGASYVPAGQRLQYDRAHT